MKRFAAILWLGFGFALRSTGQWTVYDPAVHNQLLASTAQEVAKFVEMINNQVKQIQTLTDQANTLHQYVNLFGNPASVTVTAVVPLTIDLRQPEVGRALGEIEAVVSGTRAMVSDGGGVFSP
jgi:conjugal transfer/entry exclusion protein